MLTESYQCGPVDIERAIGAAQNQRVDGKIKFAA